MFNGKIIVITGGSSGVGKALAEKLLKRGACVALVARDMDRLNTAKKELAAGLPAGEHNLEIFSCDVTDETAAENTMRAIANIMGGPHILINSAGILRENYFQNLSVSVFRQVMDINFFGTLNCIKAVLPYFRLAGGGRIVNMSSLAGMMGVFGYSAYCSSKYAVKGLSDTLRVELRPENIKLHVVCAPEFESPMVDELNRGRTPENRKMAHILPVLKAEDVADSTISGMEKNRYEIIPGAQSRVVAALDRIFPDLSRAVTDLNIKRHYRGPGADDQE